MVDVIVIGAGPGGVSAAVSAEKSGLDVVLIERDMTGGTCLNRGCIPTKTLLHASELYAQMKENDVVTASGLSLDFAALRRRVADVTGELRFGIDARIGKSKIEYLRGCAHVRASGEVAIDTADGTLVRRGRHLIVACGSAPAILGIEGADLPGVYTSDTLLQEIPDLKSLVIIGGGVVGSEFAAFYAHIGTAVTVLEAQSRILPTMDRELSRGLAAQLKAAGAQIFEEAFVKGIASGEGAGEGEDEGGLCVTYARKGTDAQVTAEAVLLAAGRVSPTQDLFDASCMPEMHRGRICVDASMRTSIDDVYAIGDCALVDPQLAHTASAAALVAVSDIVGASCPVDFSSVPSCVYSNPEIAQVGLTETEAKEKGIAVRRTKVLMGGNGRTLASGLGRGFIKLLADEDDHLVGAQLMCGNASDIIGELTLAICSHMTVQEAKRAVRPHPSFEEAVFDALDAFSERS